MSEDINPYSPDDIELEQTCGSCPEQYEAFYKGKRVGYLRLRHGTFRVDYPDCGGDTLFTATPEGDGSFRADERDGYLMLAKLAIIERMKRDNNE